ncbi:TlpA family protein disulfide reductase [Bacteroidota bacterium]
MKHFLFFITLIIICIYCKQNKETDREIAPDIYVLDKQAPIRSFTELTNLLQGKQIYVDRWATWCSPCIEEFKHNESLHEFLKSKKIAIVYLNSDKDITENKWYEFIKSHNLRGHLRLNDELKSDLVNKGIFIPMIPQYMIINEKGVVIENNACRPSEGEKLYTQLNNFLGF